MWNYMCIGWLINWSKTLHVSDSSSVHHRECFTLLTAMVYVIQVCWQLASRIRMKPVPSWSCSQPLLCLQWKTPYDGQRNCPKYGEFYSKNKFGKLVHLVGFIIRISYFELLFQISQIMRKITKIISWYLMNHNEIKVGLIQCKNVNRWTIYGYNFI